MTDDEYYQGTFGTPERPMPTPEWVKLIPSDSIPVFIFNEDLLDLDFDIVTKQLREFFGDRKVLVIRSGDVEIYAIEDKRDE